MTTAEFVESIPEFVRLNYTEQVKRFCWHLGVQQQQKRFTGANVAKCFRDTGCPEPSSVAPFLISLAEKKAPFLIRRSNSSYELSRHARAEFDSVLGSRDSTVAVDKLLRELPSQLSLRSDKIYLEEALTCFRHRAFRAAVVMTWNLAYDHLCNKILASDRAAFNFQLPKSFPKADIAAISVRDDFEILKESQVLQVAKSANIISGSLHKILKEKLDRRNIAAHPSGVSISQLNAEDFITDLVNNVVLKL